MSKSVKIFHRPTDRQTDKPTPRSSDPELKNIYLHRLILVKILETGRILFEIIHVTHGLLQTNQPAINSQQVGVKRCFFNLSFMGKSKACHWILLIRGGKPFVPRMSGSHCLFEFEIPYFTKEVAQNTKEKGVFQVFSIFVQIFPLSRSFHPMDQLVWSIRFFRYPY